MQIFLFYSFNRRFMWKTSGSLEMIENISFFSLTVFSRLHSNWPDWKKALRNSFVNHFNNNKIKLLSTTWCQVHFRLDIVIRDFANKLILLTTALNIFDYSQMFLHENCVLVNLICDTFHRISHILLFLFSSGLWMRMNGV